LYLNRGSDGAFAYHVAVHIGCGIGVVTSYHCSVESVTVSGQTVG
jgi:hypothetical protein